MINDDSFEHWNLNVLCYYNRGEVWVLNPITAGSLSQKIKCMKLNKKKTRSSNQVSTFSHENSNDVLTYSTHNDIMVNMNTFNG